MALRGSLGSYLDASRLEIIKLVVIIAVTAMAFVGTRSFANRTIAVGLEDAAQWHAIGREALGRDDLPAAVDAFRRASNQDRENKTYGVALADALAMDGQAFQAERILLALRENAPEDQDINVDLARLAAMRGDVPVALRYYQSALYAPSEGQDGRRQIRIELAQFLLDHDQKERALAELIAAVDDIGDDSGQRVVVADLLLEAGDPSRALEQFDTVLAREEDNRAAAAGAGRAAYELGDYAAAVRHLESAGDGAGLGDLRQTAELVLARDPLAARIRASERRRRLTENLAYVRGRIEMCAAPAAVPPPAEAAELSQAIDDLERQIARTPGNSDLVDDGVVLVLRAERFLEPRCGASAPLDRALILVGERHLGDES